MIENNKALYPIWFIIECVRQIFQCSVDACIFMQRFEFSQAFKRKPKRLFYVKLIGEYITTRSSMTTHLSQRVMFGYRTCINNKYASIFTDAEYDRIKHLLPNDHTLELVTDKK